MNGLSVGIFWGLLVAAVGVAIMSLSTPLPERGETDAIEATTGDEAAEAAAASDETETEAGPSEGAPPETTDSDAATAQETPDGASAPDTGTSEAVVPESAEPETAAGDAAGASGAPATEVPLPSGSEFNRPPPEPEAALPSTDAPVSAASPAAPLVAGDTSAPNFDTASAALPNAATQAPTGLGTSADTGSELVAPALSSRPSVASSPTALTQPQSSQRPAVSSPLLPQIAPPSADAEPEAEPVAEVDVVETAEVAEVPEAAEAAEVTSELAEVAPEAAEVAPELAEVAPEVPATPAFPTTATIPRAPTLGEETAALSTPLFPQTSTLPQVAVPAATDPVPSGSILSDPGVPADISGAAAPDADRRAIEAFAAPFDTAEDRPLMAVVLIDEPESPIDLATLRRFTFPVAFAIDPLNPQAADRAAAFREAGFEVVILGTMIPEGGTPSDLEVALSAALVTLPESVALLDTPANRIQSDRPILDATVGALAETGHGLLAFPQGLNAAETSANRSGVPGATIFRLLDGENQRATMITRFLARAAFTSTQEGTVIVVGHTRPDTVTALFSWALGDRSEAVALAPLSATLMRASGQ